MSEVAALEEKRFTGGPGQGIGEAVAEVQTCRVTTALAEVAVGRSGDVSTSRWHEHTEPRDRTA